MKYRSTNASKLTYRLHAGLVAALLLAATPAARSGEAAPASLGPANPYRDIVTRNTFGLRPISAPAPPESYGGPPPRLALTGITTILGDKRALLKVGPSSSKPGEGPKAEESFVLAEGQRHGELQLLQVNEQTGSVRVNQGGTIMTLVFQSREAPGAEPTAAHSAGTPGIVAPARAIRGPRPSLAGIPPPSSAP